MKIELEIELLEKRLKDLRVKAKEDIRFKPKQNENFYFIDGDGNIRHAFWDDNKFDNNSYNIGNCFETYKDAEFAKEQVNTRLNNLIIQWKLKYDRVELDWKDDIVAKYFICYDYSNNKYQFGINTLRQSNVPYLSSSEKVLECIKWLEKGEQ